MSIGARQVASSFQYRSRTEVVSSGGSAASGLRAPVSAAAPASPAAAKEKPARRKRRRFCMFAFPLFLEKAALATDSSADYSRPSQPSAKKNLPTMVHTVYW
jgi:hypothetical protein